MNDPYVDPETGLLRNRLGIRDSLLLSRAEADLSHLGLTELDRRPLPGGYDLAHLRAFHRAIFGDLYPWAGELRTVEIAKSHAFCPARNIVSYGRDVFRRLARNGRLRGLEPDAFVRELADLLGDINALHPFRDGNGRAQRAFVAQLARDAGYRIQWAGLDAEANVAASVAAHHGDNGPLRDLLAPLVHRGARND
ncbi:MAG: cell filamentation protein Fic [Streptomycetaceae bacterium]|nr:cell filamentation protein Fic [Streptomycetaceae bacterium]